MASRSQNSGDGLYSRPGGTRTRRTWSSNGVNHTLQTSSSSGPHFSSNFAIYTSGPSTGQPSTQRRQGSGLLGGALNLLGGVLAAKQAVRQNNNQRQSRQAYVEDLAYGDFEEEDEEEEVNMSSQRNRAPPAQRRPSPPRRDSTRSGNSGRTRSYRNDRRRQSYASRRTSYSSETSYEESSDGDTDFDSDDVESSPPPKPRRAFTTNNTSTLQALENAAEHHRRELERCRQRFNTASTSRRINTAGLQALLNELKGHEIAYENVKAALNAARGGPANSRPQPARRSSSTTQSRSTRTGAGAFPQSIHDDPFFASFFGPNQRGGSFYASTRTRQVPFDPVMASFDDMFGNFGFQRAHTFGTMPQATFTFTNQSNPRRRASAQAGPQFQQRPNPSFATASAMSPPQPAPPPTPPKNLLQPGEAKRLFKTYNERWLALAPADPAIPYPARGHKASALCARDSIWAPMVDSPISTWSEELVMQANTQAFFLGVVGLSPTYTESPANGKLGMGYNRLKATPTQTKELVDLLKKEKMRWHSDRLGRRNGGLSIGPNEELQTDERARAVFHAVCELMNFAQGE